MPFASVSILIKGGTGSFGKAFVTMIYNCSLGSNTIKSGFKFSNDFKYNSDCNDDWMSADELKDWIQAYCKDFSLLTEMQSSVAGQHEFVE